MTPLDFLKALWENKPEERYILIWTLPDKRSHWFTDVAAAAQFVANVNFLDVYVGVGLAREDHGPTHRCVSDEIDGISGFWADLDLLAKINEVGMYLSDPVKAELYVRLTLTLGLILKTARDLTPSPINYPT